MEKHRNKLRLAAIVLLCFLNLGFGLHAGQAPMLLSGTIGLVYAATAAVKGRAPAASAVPSPLS